MQNWRLFLGRKFFVKPEPVQRPAFVRFRKPGNLLYASMLQATMLPVRHQKPVVFS